MLAVISFIFIFLWTTSTTTTITSHLVLGTLVRNYIIKRSDVLGAHIMRPKLLHKQINALAFGHAYKSYGSFLSHIYIRWSVAAFRLCRYALSCSAQCWLAGVYHRRWVATCKQTDSCESVAVCDADRGVSLFAGNAVAAATAAATVTTCLSSLILWAFGCKQSGSEFGDCEIWIKSENMNIF